MSRASLRQPASVLAIAAHPDDIEFMMAGTLLLLRERGLAVHYLNLSSGNCGSTKHNARQTRQMRLREAQRAARDLGAEFHPPMADDLEIFYGIGLLRRLASVIRLVRPAMVFTHSPEDYMEDHTNTCRLAVTAAFSRGMPNFRTVPSRKPIEQDLTVYHAMPHGLRDQLDRAIVPDRFVDTGAVQERKRAALARHQSQQSWLDSSQKTSSYLAAMNERSRTMGRMSGQFEHAEGWRRHSHLGFCEANADPLFEALGSKVMVRVPAWKTAEGREENRKRKPASLRFK